MMLNRTAGPDRGSLLAKGEVDDMNEALMACGNRLS